MSSQQTETKFLLFSTLSDNLKPTNAEFVSFAEGFVAPDAEQKLRLDWKSFLDAVTKYNTDKSDLFISGSGGNTLREQEPSAPKVIQKLVNYVKPMYNVTLGDDVLKYLTDQAQYTFDNLKQEVNGNITTSKNSWEFRFISSKPSDDSPDDAQAIVVSVTFKGLIEIEKKENSTRTTKDYSADITSTTFDVTKGFKNPNGGDEPKDTFLVVSTLPEPLKDTNSEVVKLAESYVKCDANGKLSFDWQRFGDDLTAYTGGDLATESAGSQTINQKDPGEESLVTKISNHLKGAFQVTLGANEVAGMKQLVKTTFGSLKPDGKNTAEYRIIYSALMPDDTPDSTMFYSTIITIKLAAEKKMINSNYSAVITYRRLFVTKGYKFQGSGPGPDPSTRPIFSVTSTLPASLEPTNKEVVGFAERFVKPDANKKLRLDWSAFQAAVSGYTGDFLASEAGGGNTINQADASETTMTPKVVQYLQGAFQAKISQAEVTYLTTLIKDTFAGLKSGSGGPSEYRLIVATTEPGLDTDFYSRVATVLFDMEKAEGSSGSDNYRANFSSTRLIVSKGFVKPSA